MELLMLMGCLLFTKIEIATEETIGSNVRDLGYLETGFLLYGPPSCGKTVIAKVVADEGGANFMPIKSRKL
ncbi:hypothetical protein Vadar_015343 [Vaccinium darrowii]|uniref:Uncharacterized protein n=1 Tax=Vaccinium darrowii TaxID=229202 RepID=A0ACB7ZKT5_9ERIC|nr:hypothetical protein Vadar_015343 [Vaccinium darrowii]